LNNLSSDLKEKVLVAARKRDNSPGNTKARARALKEVAGIDLHPDKPAPKTRLPAHGGSEPMDPDRAVRRICNVVHATFDHENYRAIREALETGAWRLSDRDLIGLATVSDRLIPKLIDCIRLQDPRGFGSWVRTVTAARKFLVADLAAGLAQFSVSIVHFQRLAVGIQDVK
jgi:hypothetical protein